MDTIGDLNLPVNIYTIDFRKAKEPGKECHSFDGMLRAFLRKKFRLSFACDFNYFTVDGVFQFKIDAGYVYESEIHRSDTGKADPRDVLRATEEISRRDKLTQLWMNNIKTAGIIPDFEVKVKPYKNWGVNADIDIEDAGEYARRRS